MSRKKKSEPIPEWWEEDWAIPVLGIVAVAAYIVIRDMRAEALAAQQRQEQVVQRG